MDARRLVACWNACEGISTKALERCANMVGHPDNVALIEAAIAKVEAPAS